MSGTKPVIREIIVVEGVYDKNTLLQVVEATVIETHGFGLFKNTDLKSLLARLAAARGLIVLTDSDGAGFVIRNHLRGILPAGQVKHAYIPDCPGKERRKRAPGAEGKLGVEGMRPEVLLEALSQAGATFEGEAGEPAAPRTALTKADLYALGLSGGEGSAVKRKALQRRLDLPEHLTANALLRVLEALYSREEVEALVGECAGFPAGEPPRPPSASTPPQRGIGDGGAECRITEGTTGDW